MARDCLRPWMDRPSDEDPEAEAMPTQGLHLVPSWHPATPPPHPDWQTPRWEMENESQVDVDPRGEPDDFEFEVASY
ncbi:hypothetical protein [Myxococcus stipitatus]|uniref:hypothetical protein n=1 Tax=Myxococcus stipitatus TaxID=83455 RepID=UPI0030CB6220